MIYLLLLAPIFLTQVDVDAPADVDGQARRLVRQLDAGELDVRNHAEEELLRLGPRVLESLPSDATGSAELQQRLQRAFARPWKDEPPTRRCRAPPFRFPAC